MSLAEEHGLRGYDAVHLAAALELQDRRRAMQLPLLTFVSADDDQLRAAAAEGCPKENPNWHP
jgi:predicted nucleic acid-binding protein